MAVLLSNQLRAMWDKLFSKYQLPYEGDAFDLSMYISVCLYTMVCSIIRKNRRLWRIHTDQRVFDPRGLAWDADSLRLAASSLDDT